MGREIRFRAWDGKQMIQADHSDWEDFFIEPDGGIWKSFENGTYAPYRYKERVDFQIMQYTGCKDRNGVEIYEGDILKVWRKPKEGYECVGQVVYSVGYWDIYFKDYFPNRTDLHLWLLDCEVIGNIHQNPELL